jgi:hypothetical protein
MSIYVYDDDYITSDSEAIGVLIGLLVPFILIAAILIWLFW